MASKISASFRVIKLLKNFPIYFADYFHLKKGIILYRLRNGIRYLIRAGTTDRFIINEIWLHKIYSPKGFEIKKQDVVVEVGGHIGVFTIYAASRAKKVYVFEPSPENFSLLSKNIKINYLKNVDARTSALSNKDGFKELSISEDENKGSNSFYLLNNGSEKIKVKTESAAKFFSSIKSNIDLLKMDCEGAEYEILFSLSPKIIRKIRKIAMEYHNIDEKRNIRTLAAFLRKNGFKLRYKGSHIGSLYAINTS